MERFTATLGALSIGALVFALTGLGPFAALTMSIALMYGLSEAYSID